jgi:glycosidase
VVQLTSNALTLLFVTNGIPIVYYGMEQGFSGGSDPANREALWPSGYANTSTVQVITKLNKLRSWMIKMDASPSQNRKREEGATWQQNEKFWKEREQNMAPALSSEEEAIFGSGINKSDDGTSDVGFIESTAVVVGASKEVMAVVRGSIIGVVTNIGSPVCILLR